MIAISRQQNPGFLTLVHGAAWFFIVASLGHLIWVIGAKIGEPSGPLTLYDAFSYDGFFGLLQAFVQAGAVAAAATMTLLRDTRRRRIGHVVLVGWAAWWAFNLSWSMGRGVNFDAMSQATISTALLACTVYRALFGWTPRPATAEPGLPEAPLMQSEASRTASWRDLRTDEAPEARLAIHLRDVPQSRSLEEVEPSRRARVKDVVSKAGKKVKRAAESIPVRRAERAVRVGVSKALKKLSEVAGRGAERLGDTEQTPAKPEQAQADDEPIGRNVA